MYNNEITYHSKWDTPENVNYRKRLDSYIDGTMCSSDLSLIHI